MLDLCEKRRLRLQRTGARSAPRTLHLLVRALLLMSLALLASATPVVAQQNVMQLWSNDALPPGLAFGDFDNDGKTDVFRSLGGQWQFSSGGIGPWTNLASDATPQDELRFGDFNGDGVTDLFSRAPDGRWRYSAGGITNWIDLASDPISLSDLRFGDFDGDNVTDVFSVAPDGRWRYSSAGTGNWTNLAIDTLPVSELRFGYFDVGPQMDVFSRAADGRWRYSAGGLVSWANLAIDSLPLSELRFGDFDGDGKTDIFSRAPNGRWRYSAGGLSNWIELAIDPTPLAQLGFADFSGDGRTDVFSIGTDGRWRYSSAGQSNWLLLGPPELLGATPTSTPTPTFPFFVTFTPTPTPTPTFPFFVTFTPTPTPTPTFPFFVTFTPTPTPTPTFPFFVTFTPTPTPTPTFPFFVTFTPTPTGQATTLPPGCVDVIVNGGFENFAAWQFGNSPIPARYTNLPVRSGSRAMLLGNLPGLASPHIASYSSVRQLVNVPRAQVVQLRWWHWHQSQLPPTEFPSPPQDRQEVILLHPNGETLAVLQRVRRNDGGWQQSALDLTPYAGRSFILYLNVYNSGGGTYTLSFLDDVELIVCGLY